MRRAADPLPMKRAKKHDMTKQKNARSEVAVGGGRRRKNYKGTVHA